MNVVDDIRREHEGLTEVVTVTLGLLHRFRRRGGFFVNCHLPVYSFEISRPSLEDQLLLGRLEIVVVPQRLAGDELLEVIDALVRDHVVHL